MLITMVLNAASNFKYLTQEGCTPASPVFSVSWMMIKTIQKKAQTDRYFLFQALVKNGNYVEVYYTMIFLFHVSLMIEVAS